jgi:hypothetical protein
VDLPAQVYLKWLRVRRMIDAKAGRPVEDWECLQALLRPVLAVLDDGSVPAQETG